MKEKDLVRKVSSYVSAALGIALGVLMAGFIVFLLYVMMTQPFYWAKRSEEYAKRDYAATILSDEVLTQAEKNATIIAIADAYIDGIISSSKYTAANKDERIQLVMERLDTLVSLGLVTEGSVYYDDKDNMVMYEYITGAKGAIPIEGFGNDYN